MKAFENVVNCLIYNSYEFNRLHCPHVPYEKWRNIYADAEKFEKIFDNNLKQKNKELEHVVST